MDGKENVLFLSPFFRPNIGGVETHLNDLCEHLRKNGYKVFVNTYQPLTTHARGQRIERKKNIEIHRLQWFGYNLFPRLEPYPLLEFLYLTPMLFLYSFFFMLKHKKDIDVIHAHGFNCALITKFLAKIFKKRSVLSVWTVYELDKRPLLAKMVRWVLSDLDIILPLSESAKNDLKVAGLPQSKMKIYTEWVDQNKFRPLEQEKCKKDLNLSGKFVVLFVGRFIEVKGMNLLLEAASKVDPKINFVFIGDGPLADKIRKRSETLPNVIFIGKINPFTKISAEYLVKCYNAADIFIVPSLCEEGFGTVNLEALSCGTPIIASNRGGLPEVIDTSVGVLLNPTVENIVKKIEYHYRNPDELKKLRGNCRKYAESRFSKKNAKVVEDAYRSRAVK